MSGGEIFFIFFFATKLSIIAPKDIMLYGHVITHVKTFVDLYCGLNCEFFSFLAYKRYFS